MEIIEVMVMTVAVAVEVMAAAAAMAAVVVTGVCCSYDITTYHNQNTYIGPVLP